MADRFPLIVDSTTQTIKELPSGDNLDLTGSSIVNASSIDVTGTVTADGLTVGDTSSSFSGVYIISSATGESELRMGDTDTDAGSIAYTNSDDTMTFRAAAGTRMSLDSTGIDVTGGVTATGILEASDGTNGEMQFGLGTALTTGAGTYDSSVRWNGSSGNLLFSQGAVEKMRITTTGIDVTGTVTADGLTVEGASAGGTYITSSSGPAGGDIKIEHIVNAGRSLNTINSESGINSAIPLAFATANTQRMLIASNGDISFNENTGNTAKFFWDASAEKATIGNIVISENADSIYTASGALYLKTVDASDMYFRTNNVTRATIDASGNVKIADGDLEFTATQSNYTISVPDAAANIFNTGDRGNITIKASGSTSGSQAMSGGRVFITAGNSHNGQTGDIVLSTGTNLLNAFDNGVIRFNIGGTASGDEAMRINASGNVGIGVIPASDWNSGYHALQLGETATFMSPVSGDGSWISNNAIFSSSGDWEYIQTAATSSLDMQSGTAPFRFRYAASGTAGTAISWSEAMRIDASGNISFYENTGTTAKFFWDASAESLLIGQNTGDNFNSDSLLRIGRSGDRAFLQFKTDDSNNNGILFGTETDDVRHQILFNATDDALTFIGNSEEAMRIDSDGDVGIGNATVASTRFAVTGSVVGANIETTSATAGHEALIVNRQNSDGTAIAINRGVTTVGSIGAVSGDLGIGNGTAGLRFFDQEDSVIPYNATTQASDNNVVNIGRAANRFRDLFIGNDIGHLDAADNPRLLYDKSANLLGNAGTNGTFATLSKSSGSFKIDHPLPEKTETHYLVHSFVESPQANNIYRGKVDLVDGSAAVNIDDAAGMTEGTYVLLNTNTQCFTSNESGWTAVKGSVSGNILTITAQDNTCTDTISWMVIGERHDQHMLDTEWTDENGKVIVEPLKES